MDQDEALATLKRAVSTRAMIALGRDYQLQSLLAVWEYVEFANGPPALAGAASVGAGQTNVPELIRRAWDRRRVDLNSVRLLLGPAFPAGEVVGRAIALGLAYPDGTVHRMAETWLGAEAVKMTKRMLSGAKGEDAER